MKLTTFDAPQTFRSLKRKFPGAFFFESQERTIIGLDSEESVRLVGERVLVTKGGLTEELQASFLEYLAQKLASLSTAESTFPYEHGGAFGTLGYEVVAQIEPRLKSAGYFRELKGSDEVLGELFFSKNLIIFEHAEEKVYFALQTLELGPGDLVSRELRSSAAAGPLSFGFGELDTHMGEEKFLRNVQQIQAHITAGDIFQAVLSERFEYKSEIHPLDLFSQVKQSCPSAYSFYFDFKESSFFGASPETLVRVQTDGLETHPIAGTRPRGRDAEEDRLLEQELKLSSKEGAEHLMLVDLARNDLGRVSAPGSVKVETFRKVLKLSNVMHLISVVSGKRKTGKTNLEALSACFPAGTLSGAPKVRAMEILAALETRPRGFYGGAVVAMDHGGNMDSCIAIRSVEVKDRTVILRAGAGIVADSNPREEYEEVKHKLKALLSAVKATEGLDSFNTSVIA